MELAGAVQKKQAAVKKEDFVEASRWKHCEEQLANAAGCVEALQQVLLEKEVAIRVEDFEAAAELKLRERKLEEENQYWSNASNATSHHDNTTTSYNTATSFGDSMKGASKENKHIHTRNTKSNVWNAW